MTGQYRPIKSATYIGRARLDAHSRACLNDASSNDDRSTPLGLDQRLRSQPFSRSPGRSLGLCTVTEPLIRPQTCLCTPASPHTFSATYRCVGGSHCVLWHRSVPLSFLCPRPRLFVCMFVAVTPSSAAELTRHHYFSLSIAFFGYFVLPRPAVLLLWSN